MCRLPVFMRKICITVFTAFSCITGVANAELILSAPPRETPEKGQEIYRPIAEHLSKFLERQSSTNILKDGFNTLSICGRISTISFFMVLTRNRMGLVIGKIPLYG